jgi:hypothetical protein
MSKTAVLATINKQSQHEQMRHSRARSRVVPPAAPGEPKHLLVVIDHREARVYTAELHGAVPQRITPYDPGGFGRHLHYVQDDSSGQRKPERKSFYEAVAKTLRGAAKVLVFGSGTGASSAMERLLKELKRHHPDVAEHIVGSIVVNAQHMSGDQMLAQARAFYTAERKAERT